MINDPIKYNEVIPNNTSALSKIFSSSKRLWFNGLKKEQSIAFDKYVKPSEFDTNKPLKLLNVILRPFHLKAGGVWVKVIGTTTNEEGQAIQAEQYARVNKNSLCTRLHIPKKDLESWLIKHPNGDVTQLVSRKVNEAIVNSSESSDSEKATAHAFLALSYESTGEDLESVKHGEKALLKPELISHNLVKGINKILCGIVIKDKIMSQDKKHDILETASIFGSSSEAELMLSQFHITEEIASNRPLKQTEVNAAIFKMNNERYSSNYKDLVYSAFTSYVKSSTPENLDSVKSSALKLGVSLFVYYSRTGNKLAGDSLDQLKGLFSERLNALKKTFPNEKEEVLTKLAIYEFIVHSEEIFSDNDKVRFSAYKEMGDFYYQAEKYEDANKNYLKIQESVPLLRISNLLSTTDDIKRYLDCRSKMGPQKT